MDPQNSTLRTLPFNAEASFQKGAYYIIGVCCIKNVQAKDGKTLAALVYNDATCRHAFSDIDQLNGLIKNKDDPHLPAYIRALRMLCTIENVITPDQWGDVQNDPTRASLINLGPYMTYQKLGEAVLELAASK